jgi:hypothetical protein
VRVTPVFALGLTTLLAATLHADTPLAAPPADLLENGGFEQGLDGWRPEEGHQLIRDGKQARSGQACLAGEVTKPNKALILERDVAVRQGNRYEFVVWARATQRTKLVLWVQQPGTKRRQMVAAWPRVPARWRAYRVALPVAASGELTLQIVAPSSFGEPAGRMWIDDVALLESPMPEMLSVSQGEGFNDEPTLAAGPEGSVFVAWNSFREGADSLQVARFVPEKKSYRRAGLWQIVGGPGTYVHGVRAVACGDSVAVLYAAEVDGNWDVYVVHCDGDGPAEPIRITEHDAVDVDPAAAWHGGKLWVAWESNRNGPRQVFVAALEEDRPGEPEPLSPGDRSSYDPDVAVLGSGEVCAAWHSFHQGNYDVILRRKPAGSVWQPERRLTEAPTIDRHVQLLPRGNELWVIYENAQIKEYHIGATNRRRLVLARVEPDRLTSPATAGPCPLNARCEAASARFDAEGRLWVSMRTPRLPRAGWDAKVTCLAGDRWMPGAALVGRKGMDRPVNFCIQGDRLLAAVQTDTIPNSWSDLDKTHTAVSEIVVAVADTSQAPPAAPVAWEPLAENDEPFEPAEIRKAWGEELDTPEIQSGGETLKLFFGDLHEHSEVSVCNRVGDQSIDESYQHMRDIARYDFGATTDHGYNFNPYLWAYTGKLVRINEDPDRFLTFLAEEWTSSEEDYTEKYPHGYYGHRNLILADPYFPRWWNARGGQKPDAVWRELVEMDADFVHIPHQLADTGNVPTAWEYVDERLQPVAEIFQVRGSYEYAGCPRQARRSVEEPGNYLQDAWARGIVIGVIASPDHGGGYGKACVYSPELSREAILDSLRQRRCYGTTGAKIVLDVRVDGHLMGSKLAEPADAEVEIVVRARCPGEIDRIEIGRNNEFIACRRPEGKAAEWTHVDRDPPEGFVYYYVRLIQADEEIAWTSPVWFGAR